MKLITKRTILLIFGIIASFLLGYYNAAVGVIFIVLLFMLIIFMERDDKEYIHSIHYRSFNDFFKNVHLYHYSSFFLYSPLILIIYFSYEGFIPFYFWITVIMIIIYLFIITLAFFSEGKIKFLDEFLIIGSLTKLYSNIIYDDIKNFKIEDNNIIIISNTKIKLRNFIKPQLKKVKTILLSKGVKER